MDVQPLIARAFPRRSVAGYEVLAGGLINTNLKVHFKEDLRPVVLRVYRDGSDACRKELAIHKLIRNEVPVAEIIHAECNGVDGYPSFAVVEYVEGLTFQQLKRTNNLAAIQQAAASVGETLARIASFHFSTPGELLVDQRSGELAVGKKFIDGPDPIPRIMDRFLDSRIFQRRAEVDLVKLVHDFAWSYAPLLPDLGNECHLVHNDYGNRNILVNEVNGTWRVAAILDWELAISGSPLLDVGHFLRYERNDRPLREPHFSRAFIEHGGHLPNRWQQIVKVVDLTGLVECLSHQDLPDNVESELLELIKQTLTMGTSIL